MGRLIFVTGGARSGKSRFAEQLATATLDVPVVYLATMETGDDELRDRVARHRERRPSSWTTIEAPMNVVEAIQALDGRATVLLDCLSLWVSNLLLAAVPEPDDASAEMWAAAIDAIVGAADEALGAQRERMGTLIAVTNEVGLGVVPANPLGRAYRDALGLVNQRFAAASDEAHLLVAGLPLRLK